MAEKRLDEFTELTEFANDDLGMVVDQSVSPTPGVTGQTKKFQFSTLFTWITGQLTKAMVGLSNVDNTSDADKPRSTATINADTALQNNIDDEEAARIAADSALSNSIDGKLPTLGFSTITVPTPTVGDWYTVAELNNTMGIAELEYNANAPLRRDLMQLTIGDSFEGNPFISIVSKTCFSSDIGISGMRIMSDTTGTYRSIFQVQFNNTISGASRTFRLKNYVGGFDNWDLITPAIQNTIPNYTVMCELTVQGNEDTQQSSNHYVLDNKRVLNTDDLTTVNDAIDDEEAARVAADSALADSIATATENVEWADLLNSPFLLWRQDLYEDSATGQTNFDGWLYDGFINTTDTVIQDDIWDSYFASPEGQADFTNWNAGPGGGTGTENQFRASGEGMAGLDIWKNSPMGESTLKTTPAWTTWTNTYDFSDYLASATGQSQFSTWLSGQTLGAREFLDAIVNP